MYSGFVDDVMFSPNGPYGALCVFLSSESITAETSCIYRLQPDFAKRQRSASAYRGLHTGGRSLLSTIALLETGTT